MTSQGANANLNGANFEKSIANGLIDKGLSIVVANAVVNYLTEQNVSGSFRKGAETKYLKKDVKSHQGVSDIVILDNDDKSLVRIECKYTFVTGSNLEKNYYPIVVSLKGVINEPYNVVVLGGKWDTHYPDHINELKDFVKLVNANIHILREGDEFDSFIDELKEKHGL